MKNNYLISLLLIGTTFLLAVGCKKESNNSTSSGVTGGSSSGNTVTDIDGNVYQTVTIGTQVWMKENLRTTSFRNGVSIPNVTSASVWGDLSTRAAWCFYANDPANDTIRGKLYNWYAVNDARGIAPVGWHVATDAEWTILENYLGGAAVAGNKMKTTSGWTTNHGTDSSGFSAVPGGFRTKDGANFFTRTNSAYYWNTDEASDSTAISHYLDHTQAAEFRDPFDKRFGFSVRCIKG